MFREFPELLSKELIAYLRKSRSDDPSLNDDIGTKSVPISFLYILM